MKHPSFSLDSTPRQRFPLFYLEEWLVIVLFPADFTTPFIKEPAPVLFWSQGLCTPFSSSSPSFFLVAFLSFFVFDATSFR